MLRIIKRIFSAKRSPETSSSKEESSKTKKRSPKTNKTRKSILKRSSTTDTTTTTTTTTASTTSKKSLVFSPEIHSIREFSDDKGSDSGSDKGSDNGSHNGSDKSLSNKKISACNPPQRPKTFPCRNKYTVFDNIDEFNVYAREVSDKIVKQRQRGLSSVKEHYKTMKNTLKERGHYRKKIPPQYRLYDKDSGKIIDLRLFPDDDDEDDDNNTK